MFKLVILISVCLASHLASGSLINGCIEPPAQFPFDTLQVFT